MLALCAAYDSDGCGTVHYEAFMEHVTSENSHGTRSCSQNEDIERGIAQQRTTNQNSRLVSVCDKGRTRHILADKSLMKAKDQLADLNKRRQPALVKYGRRAGSSSSEPSIPLQRRLQFDVRRGAYTMQAV